MTPDMLEAAARGLSAARGGGAPIQPLPVPPATEREAYALQRAVHVGLAERGRGVVVGHKIGCTTPVMQAYLGIDHPCAGGILADTVQRGHGELKAAEHHRIGVECEIAVTLREDVTAADGVEDAVAAVMPAIEIVEDRYADFGSLGAMTLVADDFFGAGCVLGQADDGWRGRDLAALEGAMWVNDALAGRGTGADILGHPLNALRWLAELRLRLGEPLRAGEFVLLGSVVKTAWLSAGDEVRIDFPGLGGASLSLS